MTVVLQLSRQLCVTAPYGNVQSKHEPGIKIIVNYCVKSIV
jgi:hypothetical protein